VNEVTNNAPLSQLLPSNQSVRAAAEVDVNKPHVNFDPTLGSHNAMGKAPAFGLSNNLYANAGSNNVDVNTATRLLANRSNVNFDASPILSNNPLTSTTEFDSWKSKQLSVGFRGRTLTTRFNDGASTEVTTGPNDQPLRLYTGSDVGALTTLRSPY